MKESLADQLKTIKFDFSDYSRLPIREDVMVFKKDNHDDKEIMKQWEKLIYLQKHLKTIDRYINKNKGETLSQWLKDNNTGLSKMVVDKIGSNNDSTGGITMYFLNLQNYYDGEEEKYDSMEMSAKMPSDLERIVKELRDARIEKRQNRKKARKIKMKDLKTDGKGYLYVESEEPTNEVPNEVKKEEKTDSVVAAVKTSKKNIAIWIAGTTILVGVAAYIMTDKK